MDSLSLPQLIQAAELFRRAAKRDQCERLLRKAMELYPLDARPPLCLGKLLIQDGGSESQADALDTLHNLLSSESIPVQDPEPFALIAGLLIKLQQPELAAIWSERGLAMFPTASICHYNLNVALRQLGRLEVGLERLVGVLLRDFNVDVGVVSGFLESSKPLPADVDAARAVCVVLVKWGKKYGPEYANRLAAGLRRHEGVGSQVLLRVLCFTDDAEGLDPALLEVRDLPAPASVEGQLTGWWLKAFLFSSEASLPRGRIVYIDLDTVVSGEWSFLLDTESKSGAPALLLLSAQSMSRTEGRSCGLNSSVMCWEETGCQSCVRGPDCGGSRYHSIYDFLVLNYSAITAVMYKFDHFLELVFLSNRARSCIFIDEKYPFKVVDYLSVERVIRDCDGSEPETSHPFSLVTFPIHPKPHDVAHLPWMQQHWMSAES